MHSANYLASIRRPGARSLLLVVASTLLPLAAHAELSNDTLLGAGVRTRPAYDGSDSQKLEVVPVVRYFGEHVFARSTQGVLEGGARAELAPGLHAGAQIAYEPGRKADESDLLQARRVEDIDMGASVGVHVEWDHLFDPVPVTVLARVRRHVDADHGTQADLRFSVGIFQSGPVGAGLFTQATWADAKATNTLYGLTPQQAAAGAWPAYSASGGLMAGSVGLLWSVDLAPRWVIVGNLEARRLYGSAARSPLAERRSSHYASAGLAYRF